jgi:hypothetical protein
VFRLAASFPLHERQHVPYKITGDELYPFDPNAFLQSLVEETGVAHTWEPVPTKITDGGRSYAMSFMPSAAPDSDREARHKTRALLRLIWNRFSGIDDVVGPEQARAELSAVLFEDFLIANTDLVQRVVDAYRNADHVGMDTLPEIEERANQAPGVTAVVAVPATKTIPIRLPIRKTKKWAPIHLNS